MKQHRQRKRVGCYTIPYSAVSITQVLARCQPGMLSNRSHVGGTTATAAGDATPKPNSLIGGTKAMSKVPARVSVAAKLANLLQQMQSSPQSQKGYKKATAFPLFLQNLQQKSRKGRS